MGQEFDVAQEINTESGFKPHRAGCAWQVPTEAVLAHLNDSGCG